MRKSRCFQSIRRQYFYPELKRCPYCRQHLHLLLGLYLKRQSAVAQEGTGMFVRAVKRERWEAQNG